jgi:hypothetical protein
MVMPYHLLVHGDAFGAWQISFWSVIIRDAMFIVSSS